MRLKQMFESLSFRLLVGVALSCGSLVGLVWHRASEEGCGMTCIQTVPDGAGAVPDKRKQGLSAEAEGWPSGSLKELVITAAAAMVLGSCGGLLVAFFPVRSALNAERLQAEAKRAEYDDKLLEMSRRLVSAEETERRNIARELHDEIGQSLTVTEMNLQALLASPGSEAMAARLRQSLEVVECVQEQVHALSLNLRPSMLDDLGLEATLRWYAKRQAVVAGLRIAVLVEPLQHRLDAGIETGCFRIVQEALNNAVKHARARAVTVELTRNDEQLHLSVRDDGIGFDVASVREQAVLGASLGLLSMEERAAAAGGGLRYLAIPSRGTEVHAWFPLKWAQIPLLTGAA